MKKVLSLMLTTTFLIAVFSGSILAQPGKGFNNRKGQSFSDIQGHWGADCIMKMQARGLLHGDGDGFFRPDDSITSDELAALIDRLREELKITNEEDDNSDYDNNYLREVPPWAQKAVRHGVRQNYINLKRFHSQVQVDRLQACVELAKALGLEPVTDHGRNPFRDMDLFQDDEDFGYILALYQAGYIKGDIWGNFNPNGLLRRAEMACILDLILRGDYSDDDTAPTWPEDSEVTAIKITSTSVTLRWTAAADNALVTGYKVVYSDGDSDTKLVGLSRSTTITGLEPDETYEFTVEARDLAGNWSDDGPSIEVTTQETSPEEDTIKPHWSNEDLTATDQTDSTITLEWEGALDNVEVTKYKVYVYLDNDLQDILYSSDDNITVTGLDADTEYEYRVEAGDAAGNWSTDGPRESFSTTQ